MSRLLIDLTYSVLRNPQVGETKLEDVLYSEILRTGRGELFAAVKTYPGPKMPKRGRGVQGYIASYRKGLLFAKPVALKKDILISILEEGAGLAIAPFFSILGEMAHLTGHLTAKQFFSMIEKEDDNNEHLKASLNTRKTFYIPYAGLIEARERRLHTWTYDWHTRILTWQKVNGEKLSHVIMYQSGNRNRESFFGPASSFIAQRLMLEIEYLLEQIKEEITGVGFMVEQAKTLIGEYGKDLQEHVKSIYSKMVQAQDAALRSKGYNTDKLYNTPLPKDKQMATAVLERLSITIPSFNLVPHGCNWIELLEQTADGKTI